MKIQHNISAINSQRNISTTSGTMSKNLENSVQAIRLTELETMPLVLLYLKECGRRLQV